MLNLKAHFFLAYWHNIFYDDKIRIIFIKLQPNINDGALL